jgi:hypothetical protein
MEPRIRSLADKIMNSVAKLYTDVRVMLAPRKRATPTMEERDYFIVLEQAWLFRTWLAKVANQCSRGVPSRAIHCDEPRLHVEVRCMAVPVYLISEFPV